MLAVGTDPSKHPAWNIAAIIYWISTMPKKLGWISVQFSSVAQSCPTLCHPWTAARQASLSIANSWSIPKPMSIESVMSSNKLILLSPSVAPSSSCLQIFPAFGSFPMSQLFASGDQSNGVSASTSVPPIDTQNWWSPSEWTGWISLLSKGLLRVFSNTTVQKHQFFSAQLSL